MALQIFCNEGGHAWAPHNISIHCINVVRRMVISTFYARQTKLISSVIRKVYLAIVGEPFISLIYGVASRIVDIFALTAP